MAEFKCLKAVFISKEVIMDALARNNLLCYTENDVSTKVRGRRKS